jgi:hypothetical protein
MGKYPWSDKQDERREERRPTMKAKKKELDLPKLRLKAQSIFNAAIRERDKELGCISCGNPVDQAGHYFSQGHYGSLRYDEMNCHGQCKKCNLFLSGNLIKYRQGLVKRYGEQKVLLLELSSEVRKTKTWSRLELEAIIQTYGKKGKERNEDQRA